MTKEKPQTEERDDSVHFTRHSKAEYKTYRKIRGSENPQASINPEDQVTPDLSVEGVELAEQKAKELLSRFNPNDDILFFASSNEARALETANIYRQIAHDLGFEVIKPSKAGSKFAEELGEGEIRVVRNLSLNTKNVLLQGLFNPEQSKGVNWDALDPETRRKCEQVQAIIREHDYGSFGANFYHHSEKVQEIFPEIKSARDMFETQFKNLLKIARFGIEKAKLAGLEKNVRILAFGHENYMGYALNKYFGDHEIKNCETIDIDVDTEGLIMTKRGEHYSINRDKKF